MGCIDMILSQCANFTLCRHRTMSVSSKTQPAGIIAAIILEQKNGDERSRLYFHAARRLFFSCASSFFVGHALTRCELPHERHLRKFECSPGPAAYVKYPDDRFPAPTCLCRRHILP